MTTVDVTAAPLLAARTALKAALEAVTFTNEDGDTVTLDVYLYSGATLATPCVVIEPNGFAPAHASGTVVAYTATISCLYNSGDLATSVDGAEEMARLVYKACAGAGWLPADVPGPTAITSNDRTYIGVQFTAGTRTTI